MIGLEILDTSLGEQRVHWSVYVGESKEATLTSS